MRPVIRYHKVPNVIDELFRDDLLGGIAENKINKPAVNIGETETEYSLNLAVPGYDKNELKVSVDNKILTISHETENKDKENSKFLRREFTKGNFKRTFKLPENAEADKIEASHINGVLTISIPKKAKVEIPVHEIQVK
jgi:HSP20 family protein